MSRARLKQEQLAALAEEENQEIRKLELRIAEFEHLRLAQKSDYEALIVRRDFLGGQLIRRNDEVALLSEKIEIQNHILRSGNDAFKTLLDEMRRTTILRNDLQRRAGF